MNNIILSYQQTTIYYWQVIAVLRRYTMSNIALPLEILYSDTIQTLKYNAIPLR